MIKEESSNHAYGSNRHAVLVRYAIPTRFAGIFHSNFGRLAAELQYAKGHTLTPYAFQDKDLCDHSGHNHPDRDGYFNDK